MKKPNITEGEWKSPGGNNHCVIAIKEDGDVEKVIEHARLYDAFAISAVPDMMDALISVWEQLERLDDWGEDLPPSKIEKIYNALKKAGVQI